MKCVFILLISLTFSLISCDRVKKKTKETINKSGEVVGEAATEFVEGVSEGIDNSLACDLALSQELTTKGISLGVFSIESEYFTENGNVLRAYLIFEKDFNSEITAIVTNKMKQETGRSTISIEAESGSADYYEFIFDERTHIDVKSIIKIL